MVERIFAVSLVVKPADMCAVPILLHLQDDALRLAIRVRPLHEGTYLGIYGFALRTDEGWQHFVRAHAFTGASTSPPSIRRSAALA